MTTEPLAPHPAAEFVRDISDGFDGPDPEAGKPLSDRLRALGNRVGHGVHAVLDGPAEAYAKAAHQRSSLRTAENLSVLREANAAHRDALRSLRNDMRAFERARSEVAWWNVFNGERRAAKAVVRDTRGVVRETGTARREARRNYPMSMARITATVTGAHLVPAFVWDAVAAGVAPAVASCLSVAAAVATAATAVVARGITVAEDDGRDGERDASEDECKVLALLRDAERFALLAERRKLTDVVPTGARLTDAGIVADFELPGALDLAGLTAKLPTLRAVLSLNADTGTELRPGKTDGWVKLTIRTRSMFNGDTLWNPARQGIGVDTVTGAVVDVPVSGVHSMTGGRTNMGKSAYARVQIMRAVAHPNMAAVVLDPKRAEAYTWRGKIRTAGEALDVDERNQQIYDLLRELTAEFRHRQTLLEGLEWTATPEYPDLFISIDEGAALFRMSQITEPDPDNPSKTYKPYEDALSMAETLYGEARVVGMWFNWISQYLAKGTSIPQLVKENVGAVIGLTTKGQEGDRMLFDETAGRNGWTPSTKCGGKPGRALVGYLDTPPNPVQIWHVTEQHIRSLPDAEPWRTRAPGYFRQRQQEADEAARRAAEREAVESAPKIRMSAADRDQQVFEAVTNTPGLSMNELGRVLGVAAMTVKRSIDRLMAEGVVHQQDGGWYPSEVR